MKNLYERMIIIGMLLMPFLSHALPPTWQVIPEKSQLTFTATQNDAPVTGQFKTFTADIAFDPNDLKNSKATVVIDIGSVSASYADLTTTLLTSDWFNAKVFPKATFNSTTFTQTGKDSYQVLGTLTIRDHAIPTTLNFTITKTDANTLLVKGQTELSRTTFGVGQGEWSSTKEIKDKVLVQFNLVAATSEKSKPAQ